MLKHPKSIQSILFASFFQVMLTFLILLTGIFSWIQYKVLRDNAEADIQRTCSAVASDIDRQIREMDTVCLNVINSSTLKKTFSDYLQDQSKSGYLQAQRETTMSNILSAMEGVTSSIRQINLYGYTSGGYGTGNFIGPLMENSTDKLWYEGATELQGRRYLSVPAQNSTLSDSTGTHSDRYYISLVRLYYNAFNNPLGFAEVMKYYDVLFDSATDPNSSYPLDITITRADGTILFPLNQAGQKVSLEDVQEFDGTRINSMTREKEYYCLENASYSDLRVTVSLSLNVLLTPVLRSIVIILVLFLGLFLLCLFFARIWSRRISAPLKTIYHYLEDLDPREEFHKIDMGETGIVEIDKLSRSLNDAFQEHREMDKSMLLLKEQELQAQMLALQSQMNPHFLYNSLNNISAMAEAGMSSSVVQMCQDITSILRYISSNKDPLTTLEEELEHCDLYLKCMQLRFGDALTYDFDIDDDMLEIPVPKLCIQLLAENAAKFSTRTLPPWHIHIHGSRTENSWCIWVRDNGPGFSKDVSDSLCEKMDGILENGLLPSLALDGMGMMNIFIRLYLTYGNSFVFHFDNLATGGAYVQIGGYINEQGTAL